MPKKLTAIDLYSGIGGWATGLKLAGIDVVKSYEYWSPAAETYRQNHGGNVEVTDIREFNPSDYPKGVDIVVGSPPCTQFSYSNRGGSGNIQDGLKDIHCFFRAVEAVNPKYWAMENVPRVKGILERILNDEPNFRRYKKLFGLKDNQNISDFISVIDCSELGLPQSRKRMVAGNFPWHLLEAYKEKTDEMTLGDVLKSISGNTIVDPTYGFRITKSEVTGMEPEPALTGEERRMNEEAKNYHPVYNKMSFPDKQDRPSRTVTATCTRVSRESIVIKPPGKRHYRRLTLRERATVQGFPLTYDFFSNSYSNQLKMAGNALPPVLAYHIGLAMRKVKPTSYKAINALKYKHTIPKTRPHEVEIKVLRSAYPETRSFQAAIPGLRFGSGVRFELKNLIKNGAAQWKVRFFYGTSKDIRELELNGQHKRLLNIQKLFSIKDKSRIKKTMAKLESLLKKESNGSMQAVWAHLKDGFTPYDLIDEMGKLSEVIASSLPKKTETPKDKMLLKMLGIRCEPDDQVVNMKKFNENASKMLSGVLLGSWFNSLRKN